MEESVLVRCDSLDTASLNGRDLMTSVEHLTYHAEALDPPLGPEPTPAELAQCEAEVGTLLSIIAELNKKMGSLKAPSDPGELRPSAASRPLVPDLLSHRVKNTERKIPGETALSKPTMMDRGGGGVVWSKLQDVLSSVEDSISFRRSWAAPIAAVDLNKHKEHLRAAHESSAKARQILEDMEREFGISCTTIFQDEVSDVDKHDFAFQSQHGELDRAHSISLVDEDRDKLVNFHRGWRSGRHSPSYRPSAMSGPESVSLDWASPPYPSSPLLQRRTSRGLAPLCGPGDMSPLGSGNSNSPCTSPIGPEMESERLNRLIEYLKSRNERLSLALERRKSEAEHMSLTLNRLESDCSAQQLALRYCEECEEAYAELLSLYEVKTHQSIPDGTAAAEEAGDAPNDLLDTEELSTSFSAAGDAVEEIQIQRTPEEDREVSLRQHIQHLKRERAAICLPKPGPGAAECKMIPDSGPTQGSRTGHGSKDRPNDTKKEKASLFYELISVRDEMSDLRALIRLKEKELRCIEWSLMAQKAQDTAGAFIPEREEPEERKTQQQRLCEAAAKLGSEGDLSRPILKELQAVLHREKALKKRLALVQDSMNMALPDNNPQRRDSGEIARLTQAHSKALSSYRQIRRKYREHVWRLEQKVAAMMETQQQQQQQSTSSQSAASANSKTAIAPTESADWRREETVL
ncbi:uncharacterized protein LOC117369897 [Periophthalmus magnuspinnatus]|uniref:uncharacterized protein LOC117369897 n=1 Tax=Periophthalmus magnuspinnatus TaxID=409849 RepID=UPI00145A618A|nr:uncharacterized protein LOC117369897 [Periophthalmus magnuspinnatus]